MLNIRDQDELKRFRKLIAAIDNSTVAFPVTLYRDTRQVAVFQSGDDFVWAYSYTHGGSASMNWFAMRQGTGGARSAWEKREEAFEAH